MRGFAEASYEMTEGAMQPDAEADRKLMVQFGYHPKLDREASTREGRPIYKDTVYVMIIVPGDKESIIHRPAWEQDYARFPKQWALFKNKDQEQLVGTPLKMVPWLSAAQVKELEYFNVRTVEHLAEVNENIVGRVHGMHGLKRQAQDFIKAATEAAPLIEMRAELEARDKDMAAMKQQVQELAAALEKERDAKKVKKEA